MPLISPDFVQIFALLIVSKIFKNFQGFFCSYTSYLIIHSLVYIPLLFVFCYLELSFYFPFLFGSDICPFYLLSTIYLCTIFFFQDYFIYLFVFPKGPFLFFFIWNIFFESGNYFWTLYHQMLYLALFVVYTSYDIQMWSSSSRAIASTWFEFGHYLVRPPIGFLYKFTEDKILNCVERKPHIHVSFLLTLWFCQPVPR